jgi:hypothetical protein
MLQKLLFMAIVFIAFSVLDSQTSDAQRKKRGLLSGSEAAAETTATPAVKTPAAAPSANPSKSTGGPTATAKPADQDGPMDLFEMASKTTADKQAAAEAGKKNKAEGKDGEIEVPLPEMLTLQSDGINIMAAFFESPNAGDPEQAKVIVPMILLHDWGGSMNDLGPLAQYLQSAGHSVIVPDLRGHGRSVTMVNAAQELDYRDFNRMQIATVKKDIEQCKRKLISFNNAGKLNISMLSVLAVGDLCPMATEWTLTDWSFQNVGSIKQGQDVQSLILVSPPRKFQQSSMAKLVKHPLLAGGRGVEIPTLVIYGQNGSSAKDSSIIYNLMERKRPPSNASDDKVRWAQQSLFELALPGSGDGAQLLRPNPRLFRFIGMFNFYKISKNADNIPWASRESKK